MSHNMLIGCNLIDPLLEVKRGADYTLDITRRSLAFLKQLGYDAVEYSHACHWNDNELDTVRRMTAEFCLLPWSLHAWCGGDVLDAAAAKALADNLRIAVHAAQALGVGIIVHHPSRIALSAKGAAECLNREAELLAEVWQPGLRFALENDRHWDTMRYLVALVDQLGPEKAGVCVDTGHAALGNLQPDIALRLAAQRLITTHLHDNHGVNDDHLPPGDGTVKWDNVTGALREIGYSGCVMLELTDQPPASRRPGIQAELKRGAEAAQRLRTALASGP